MVAQALAAISLGLLGLAGAVKLIDPEPTSGALSVAGLPSGIAIARLLGLTELAAAVIGLGIGGIWSLPAGLLSLGFVGFTIMALRTESPIQSCGCFGREDTPPTWLHVSYNAAAVGALLYLVVTGDSAVTWGAETLDLILYVSFAAIGVYTSYLLLTTLPRTLAVAHR